MEVSVHVDTDVYMYTVLQTYISFSVLDLLKLTDVLSFFTGANEIPPGIFFQKPILSFDDKGVFPTASTCALHLILPTKFHEDFDQFKRHASSYSFYMPRWFSPSVKNQ